MKAQYLPWFDVILVFADTVALVMAVVVIFELGVMFDNAELVACPSARAKHTECLMSVRGASNSLAV